MCFSRNTKTSRKEKIEKEQKSKREERKEFERNGFDFFITIHSFPFPLHFSIDERVVKYSRNTSETCNCSSRRNNFEFRKKLALFFSWNTFCLVSSRGGSRITARFAHAVSNHDQGTMYNNFFMVVSSNQVLVICQERDSMNVCCVYARLLLLLRTSAVSGFHSLSCESRRGNERAVCVCCKIIANTGAIQSRVCCEFVRFSGLEVKIYPIDKLWGVQDDRVNPCLVTETFQL